jgi:hypothetical protein
LSRDVFISYRSEDKEWAERICSALESESLSCWIAPRDIPLGKQWATALVESLQSCKVLVIVLSSNTSKVSPDSKNVRQVAREAELADKAGLPIITVRIEDVQPPPDLVYFLGNVQWLDAFGDHFDTAMTQLVQALRATAQGESAPAAIAAARAAQPIPAAPKPPVKPSTVAQAGTGKASRWWMIVVAALVVAAIAWFVVRLQSSGSDTGDLATAKSIADQFMSRVQDGDMKGAWTLTSPDFKEHQRRFRENTADEIRQDGGATGLTDKNCVYDGNGTYRCFYTLKTKTKDKDATVTVVKSESWRVQKFTFTG